MSAKKSIKVLKELNGLFGLQKDDIYDIGAFVPIIGNQK